MRDFMETLTFLFTSSFYPPYHIGGDAIHVKYLTEELVKKGHEVHVMHSLDAYTIKRGKLPGKRDHNKVVVHTLKSPLGRLDPLITYTLGNSPFVQKEFSKILKDVSPDVVHHHNLSLLGYSMLRKQGKYLSLYTAHDYWFICQTNNLLKNKKRICDKKSCFSCALISGRPPQFWRYFQGFKNAINSIDLLIAPSDYMRKRILEEIDLNSTTIPNFVPYPSNNIPSSDYSNYFLFVGMLEKHKGILNLLEVFKKYRDVIDARLIIVGTGSLKNYVKKFITSNNLEERIIYLGWKDHKSLYPLFRDAYAVVMPSIWPENAPLVALEALSMGTPVVGSNLGGLREIVDKVDENLIFKPYELERLKDILIKLRNEKYSSKEVKAVYKTYFSPQSYIDRYFESLNAI